MNTNLCPLCNQPNACALVEEKNGIATCWCGNVKINPEALKLIPKNQLNKACICQACATKSIPDVYSDIGK